ncbi:MAG TPA: HAD family hydrolase [Dysgonamonadaceae bacterium]|nr:HAD family hydrolase [Dysgonamonadaceae bacterium]
MKELMKRPDSLILDMDGTLWDNVSTYVLAWNAALKESGHSAQVTRESLMGWMGMEPRQLLDALVPDVPAEKQDLFFDRIVMHYQQLIPTMKPFIYPGVMEGLKQLHTKYKLLLLSNCEEGGLVNMMKYTKTTHLFLDYMEHGQNNMPKSYNLDLLKERNNLENPVYIGDTEGDSHESSLAGVPFVFMTYGFGTTENYHLKFDTFGELTDYYMNL